MILILRQVKRRYKPRSPKQVRARFTSLHPLAHHRHGREASALRDSPLEADRGVIVKWRGWAWVYGGWDLGK